MFRDADHGFVNNLGIMVCCHAVAFKEGESGTHCGPFVSIDERLSLGDMKSIGGRDIKQIAVSVEIDILRMENSGLQGGPIPYPRGTAKSIDCVVVDFRNLFERKESRRVHYLANLLKSSACLMRTLSLAVLKAEASM